MRHLVDLLIDCVWGATEIFFARRRDKKSAIGSPEKDDLAHEARSFDANARGELDANKIAQTIGNKTV